MVDIKQRQLEGLGSYEAYDLVLASSSQDLGLEAYVLEGREFKEEEVASAQSIVEDLDDQIDSLAAQKVSFQISTLDPAADEFADSS